MSEPLIGTKPPFPQLGFQILPDGAVFSIMLGNGVSIQQVVTADTMQQLCRAWLESRKDLMQERQVIANVMKTKRVD